MYTFSLHELINRTENYIKQKNNFFPNLRKYNHISYSFIFTEYDSCFPKMLLCVNFERFKVKVVKSTILTYFTMLPSYDVLEKFHFIQNYVCW